ATVWRWLSQDAIRPWRHRSWIFPRDPLFVEKAGPILDLYQAAEGGCRCEGSRSTAAAGSRGRAPEASRGENEKNKRGIRRRDYGSRQLSGHGCCPLSFGLGRRPFPRKGVGVGPNRVPNPKSQDVYQPQERLTYCQL